MKKKAICVIFGGKSEEYEVSLKSAYNVLESLCKESYEIYKLGITKDGRWLLFEGENKEILNDIWHKGRVKEVTLDFNSSTLLILENGKRIKIDKALIIMHGENGEDGHLQATLDLAGISYLGPDHLASSICMNKYVTKLVARAQGIRVARDVFLTKDNYCLEEIYKNVEKIGYPVFVKPNTSGSSVGVSRVENKNQLKDAIEDAFLVSSAVIVEEEIKGTETELALIEKNGKVQISTSGQLSYKGAYYSYEEKYKSQDTQYIIPSKISEETEKALRECCEKLFFALGLKGLSRIDFFVCGDEIVFNEVNTLPGMTDISMFLKLFEHDGISRKKLINLLASE
ncbi:MAG: D-alanine--D-alanine ligase [Clostridia bacterium]|nr:D-alanine--D-alanine ligase [Clostridia bacterium]